MSARALDTLSVLVVDCQATGAAPDKGHVMELGWARTAARQGPEVAAAAELVALPEGASVPWMVTRITGITDATLAGAKGPSAVWAAVVDAAAQLGQPAPAVAHFARYEDVFLRDLHHRVGGDRPFPLDLICTHEIARRLLPDLPRRGLRALAGYFGFSVAQLRRSAEHVDATAFVWRHLLAQLAESHDVHTWQQLQSWLQTTPRRTSKRRAYPMPKDKRLAVADAPGVYRLLRSNGDVLYVGKAISLKRRVNSYFQKQSKIRDRTLEMLSQARDLSVTVCETSVEAALLESEEIKRLSPPYNVALTDDSPGPWFCNQAFDELVPAPDPAHPIGPIRGRRAVAALPVISALLGGASADEQMRRAAVDMPVVAGPEPRCFDEGLALFITAHGALGSPARIAAALWRSQLQASGDDEPEDDESDEAWTPEDVKEALEDALREGYHQLRRGRWLAQLASCTVTWSEGEQRRLLHLEGGAITDRAWRPSDQAPPRTSSAVRQVASIIDLATYDRLRILTTELRRVAAGGSLVHVDLGGAAVLTGAPLMRALLWV